MRVALISIGDEVLIGQVVNRNAAWLAEELTLIGCSVAEHVTISDTAEQLTSTIDRVRTSCSVIIMTGGLGPTHDDITKDVLTSYTSDRLVMSEQWLAHLHDWMRERGREVTERNAAQALVPSRATILPNPIGTAPGLAIDHAGCLLVALPGVPTEMQHIMLDHVVPMLGDRLRESAGARAQYMTLLTAGVAESTLADMLGDPSDFLGNATLAFLPSYHGVRLRIGMRHADEAVRLQELWRVRDHILQKAGKYVYGSDKQTLAEVIGTRLRERGETLAIAESCTSGMLGARLTDVVGSSAWFLGGVMCYSNESKVRDLSVREATLAAQGAVSVEVAKELAEGVRTRFASTYGIGITGVAGPGGGSVEKPVGTVCIAVAVSGHCVSTRFQFGNDRYVNRERSVGAAMAMLWRLLK
ncbi:MAG: competence/damage-inducible protein A [Candidatus Kapabacteria bacterium]|nr:competence/damage-inducible protein A [Candidatus Kapabacteria bacterium]